MATITIIGSCRTVLQTAAIAGQAISAMNQLANEVGQIMWADCLFLYAENIKMAGENNFVHVLPRETGKISDQIGVANFLGKHTEGSSAIF